MIGSAPDEVGAFPNGTFDFTAVVLKLLPDMADPNKRGSGCTANLHRMDSDEPVVWDVEDGQYVLSLFDVAYKAAKTDANSPVGRLWSKIPPRTRQGN